MVRFSRSDSSDELTNVTHIDNIQTNIFTLYFKSFIRSKSKLLQCTCYISSLKKLSRELMLNTRVIQEI